MTTGEGTEQTNREEQGTVWVRVILLNQACSEQTGRLQTFSNSRACHHGSSYLEHTWRATLCSNWDVLMNFSAQIWDSSGFLCASFLSYQRYTEILQESQPRSKKAHVSSCPVLWLKKQTQTVWTAAICCSKGFCRHSSHGRSRSYTSSPWVAEVASNSTASMAYLLKSPTFKHIEQIFHKRYYLPDVCILEVTWKGN